MKIKKILSQRLTILQRLSIILPVFMIIGSSLIYAQSQFNNKEISVFTDSCFEVGGSPVVEMATLNLDYSFYCGK